MLALAALLTLGGPSAAADRRRDPPGCEPPPCKPAWPTQCPSQSDYVGRRAVVLQHARTLLNGTFEAGTHYGGAVFFRDTNTFIGVALESQNAAHVECAATCCQPLTPS